MSRRPRRRRRESITSRLTRWREPTHARHSLLDFVDSSSFVSLAGTRDTRPRARRTFARGVFGDTTSMLVLRRLLVPLLVIHVVLALWSGYRAIVQVFQLELQVTQPARPRRIGGRLRSRQLRPSPGDRAVGADSGGACGNARHHAGTRRRDCRLRSTPATGEAVGGPHRGRAVEVRGRPGADARDCRRFTAVAAHATAHRSRPGGAHRALTAAVRPPYRSRRKRRTPHASRAMAGKPTARDASAPGVNSVKPAPPASTVPAKGRFDRLMATRNSSRSSRLTNVTTRSSPELCSHCVAPWRSAACPRRSGMIAR